MNFILFYFVIGSVFTRRALSITCGNRIPKVLFVLVDGCRWDYLDQGNFPGFKKLSDKGTHALHVTPIFPSNSYPNWYSLVTGLYAESHGFVQNMMYDAKYEDFFMMGPHESVNVPHWWDGAEPLWVTAEKNGLRSALYWWDGCQVEIRGRQSTFCRKYQYIGNSWTSVNEDTKEAFFTALDLLENNEMQLVQLYYEPVDFYGHKFGPESVERKQALKDIDELLEMVMSEIDKRGLQDQVNLVVVSDHGMTLTDSRSITTIKLSNYLDIADIRYMIYYGANSMLLPHEGKTEKVYQALKGIPGLQVYHKEEIPEHYHLRNNRLMLPILLVADKDYLIEGLDIPGKSIPTGSSVSLGSHGYDPYQVSDMRSIFYAVGPGIRKNYTSPPLNIVDIYNVLCDLLGFEPLPNNGSRSITKGMLVPEQLLSTPCQLSDAPVLVSQIWQAITVTFICFCLQKWHLVTT
ncbi:glycerophosphocholine cholinephosphodiesterase ENPP6-like isoform X1 [Uloborus diversus]|uniref:glycerophosphocholine cholinephosphodiesterase ENPP6-like isoform X1 n=1 Tax=Uloborus diversus TaxID=327109 RepID=UPI002409283B|nr:glycerophosphocholine cholinephosphodiesterase ENPP6-like isoform X1 [Uloborus diversus]